MDWPAIELSVMLAAWTIAVLVPVGVLFGRWLAVARFRGKSLLEAMLALPLVLPPTVLGFYLLVGLGRQSVPGQWFEALTGQSIVFSFPGLVVASVLFNVPFAIQPMQRAFEAIPQDVREAALCCGLGFWRALWRIELPLAWPGILSATVMTFAHTLGEFGVVLMVGGSIPGQTKTVAIAIYDRVQAFDHPAAAQMALLLLVVSFISIALSYALSARLPRLHRTR